MAEEVPTEVSVQAAEEPIEQPVAVETAEPTAEPVAEAQPDIDPVVAAEPQDASLKRSREDGEQGVDGDEPDAKRAAAADTDVETAASEGQAQLAGDYIVPQAYENGSAGNPGHDNPGYDATAVADNPGHLSAPTMSGPLPVKEGLGTIPNEDGSVTETIAVSKHLVGKLIGKAGQTIQQLQQSTATNIQIDQEGNEFPDAKKVTIRGSTENVGKAKAAVKQMLEEAVMPQEGEVEEKVPCPAGIVGRIIGRAGETIRSLQAGSGAHILVDQNFPEGADRMVVVKGRPDSVRRAVLMVEELIKGEPGSASAIVQKHGIGSTITLTCPKGIVGRIIGKGGDTIKGLQRKYHVSIQIDQGGDPMNVTITGPKHTAELCRQEVQALINEPSGPPFGGPGPRGPGYGPRPGYGPPFGGPAPYQVPPAGFGPPYGAPYGAPYPAPGGYGGYPPAFGGAAGGYGGYPATGAYGAPATGYVAGGYGAAPAAAGGYQAAGGYSGAAAGGYGGAASSGYQQQGAYGSTGAAGGYGADTAAGGYSGQAASTGAAAGGSVWTAMQDDQGRTYYYNTQTGVSQWEKPAEMP